MIDTETPVLVQFCLIFGIRAPGIARATRGGVNAKKSKFNIRALRAQADQLNGIISSRNLYVCLPGGKRRVINCEVMSEGLTVEDLYSGNTYEVNQNKFEDGYGKEVLP